MPTMAQVIEDSLESNSVSKLLMIADYSPTDGTFQRTDGSVTSFASIDPICIVDQPYETIGDWSETLASAFSSRSIRSGSLLSWTYFVSRDISEFVDEYRRAGGDPHPTLQSQGEARIDMLIKATTSPVLSYPGTDATVTARVPKTVFSVTVNPPSRVSASMASADLESMRQKMAKEVDQILSIFDSKASSFGGRMTKLDEEDYIKVVRSLLYPQVGPKTPVGDDIDHPIFDRVPIGDVKKLSSQGAVFSDGVYFKAITLNGIPKETVPGLLSMPSRKLNGAALVDIIDQGWITVNARARDPDKDRQEFDERLKRVRGGSVLEGRASLIAEDAQRGQYWVDREHRVLFDTELIVVLWHKDLQILEDRARRLVVSMSDLLCRMRLENEAAPAFFFRSLPGNAFPPLAGARRDHCWPDRKIVDIMPIWYRSHGTAEVTSLLMGVTGMPFRLSPYGGGGTVAHAVIAGRPGTGKSVLANMLMRDHLRNPSSQGIFLDKGRSYRTATLNLGSAGQYVNVSRGSFCVNPLAGTIAEVGEVGSALIEHLATPGEGQGITAYQKGLLDQALQRTFEQERRGSEHIAYLSMSEVLGKHEGTYLHDATKYLGVEIVNDRIAVNLENILADRDANDRPYLLSIYRIVAIEVSGRTIESPTISQMVTRQDSWLRAKGYVPETDLETGEAVVYHPSRQAAAGPEAEGVFLELVTDYAVVNAPKREHVQTLMAAGVKFRIPLELSKHRATSERQAAMEETSDAPIAVIDRRVARAVEALTGLDVFDITEGHLTLQREVYLGDVCRWLEDCQDDPDVELATAAKDLVTRLSAWYGTGAKSSFFDGPTTVDLRSFKQTNFELAALADQASEHLVTAVVGSIISLITLYATSPNRLSQRLMVSADEVWQLIRYPVIARALEALVRVGRKTGVSVVVITQSLKDLTDVKVGEALIGNMPNMYVLRQPDTDIDRISEAFHLTREETAIMSGLRSRPGLYAQVMVIARDQTPRCCDTALVILTPNELWSWTTKKEEVTFREELIDRLIAQGVSDQVARTQVIEELAKQFRNGLTDAAIREMNHRRMAQASESVR